MPATSVTAEMELPVAIFPTLMGEAVNTLAPMPSVFVVLPVVVVVLLLRLR